MGSGQMTWMFFTAGAGALGYIGQGRTDVGTGKGETPYILAQGMKGLFQEPTCLGHCKRPDSL